MSKVKLIVAAGFLVAFVAGMVMGLVSRPRVGTWRGPGRMSLTQELGLNEQQREEMRRIWSEVGREAAHEREEQRRAARKQRDETIAALIPAENRGGYDKTIEEYTEKIAKIDEQRSLAVRSAMERTKQILNEEQRGKYEEMLKRREAEGWGRSATRAATQRSTARPSSATDG